MKNAKGKRIINSLNLADAQPVAQRMADHTVTIVVKIQITAPSEGAAVNLLHKRLLDVLQPVDKSVCFTLLDVHPRIQMED